MKKETFEAKIERVWQICERFVELEMLIGIYQRILADKDEGYLYSETELADTIEKYYQVKLDTEEGYKPLYNEDSLVKIIKGKL